MQFQGGFRAGLSPQLLKDRGFCLDQICMSSSLQRHSLVPDAITSLLNGSQSS
jgi:hypothetical protein